MRFCGVLALVAMLVPTSVVAAGADCFDYESYLHELGTTQHDSQATVFVVSETMALGFSSHRWSAIDLTGVDSSGLFPADYIDELSVSIPAHISAIPPEVVNGAPFRQRYQNLGSIEGNRGIGERIDKGP